MHIKNLFKNLPDFDIPKTFKNTNDYFGYLVADGIYKRYVEKEDFPPDCWEEIKKRAEYEIDVIFKMNNSQAGLLNYFLIIADYVDWAKFYNIPVGPGFGTAPGSIIAYALGITNIDPLKYNLLFERFINPERTCVPDFDIVVSSENRDKLIKYIKEKYGEDHVVHIGNYRDSLHPSSLVISRLPLIDIVNHLKKIGLLKFDLIGLTALDVIKDTEELICQRGGEYVDFSIENIPENDEATFTMLGNGDNLKIFMLNSKRLQEILKEAKPKTIQELIAIMLLYRQGLLDNLFQYIAAKNGEVSVSYPAPELEDVLKETYGIITCQEQFLQIVNIIAGYSYGKADIFRRALKKHNPKIIKKEREVFISCAVSRAYSNEKAKEIFDLLNNCVDFIFIKSHITARMLITYQCAYLKANFPAEFKAANWKTFKFDN